MLNSKSLKPISLSLLVVVYLIMTSCNSTGNNEVNIGFIAPLSTDSTEYGIGPAKTMQEAVSYYNKNKLENEPIINLFVEDDQWNPLMDIPLYKKFKFLHDIDVIFVSNPQGSQAVQKIASKDSVITINPLFAAQKPDELLIKKHLSKHKNLINENSTSVWSTMQAYDAISVVIVQSRIVNQNQVTSKEFGFNLRKSLLKTTDFTGVCGNLSMKKNNYASGMSIEIWKDLQYILNDTIKSIKAQVNAPATKIKSN